MTDAEFVAAGQLLASVSLAFLTGALVWYTKRLADDALPNVAAKLKQNSEVGSEINLIIANTGGKPAYDVQVAINPKLPIESRLRDIGERPTSFAIILPGERIEMHAVAWKEIEDQESFEIATSWSRRYQSSKKEVRRYTQFVSAFIGSVGPAKLKKHG